MYRSINLVVLRNRPIDDDNNTREPQEEEDNRHTTPTAYSYCIEGQQATETFSMGREKSLDVQEQEEGQARVDSWESTMNRSTSIGYVGVHGIPKSEQETEWRVLQDC
jgi:hypothetical protein